MLIYLNAEEKWAVHGYDPEDYAQIDSLDWNLLAPYFIPADSEVKHFLDALFLSSHFSCKQSDLDREGFIGKKSPNCTSQITVLSHPDHEEVIFKLYLDRVKIKREAERFYQRIFGAELIREYLKSRDESPILIPKKWIYPIPKREGDDFHKERSKHYFILIAEKIPASSPEEQLLLWKSAVQKEELIALYQIAFDLGLWDSVVPANALITSEGKIALIDTEHYFYSVDFTRLECYLSKEMRAFWRSLSQKKQKHLRKFEDQ